MEDASRRLDPGQAHGRFPGHAGGAQQGAVGDGVPGQGLFLLGRDGQALQRAWVAAGPVALLGGGRGAQRLLEYLLGEGVDVRFDAFRPGDDGPDQFHG